jgi:nucleotide-binding universal stress UspA family protein
MEQRMDAHVSYETRIRERAAKRLDEFITPFASSLARLSTSVVLLEGECPAAAITAHADATGIDLTVIGSREDSWVADLVLGSNTERLMRDSTSSVLITRG